MKYLCYSLIAFIFNGCAAPKTEKAETKVKSQIYRSYPNFLNYHCPYGDLDTFHRNLYNGVDNSGGER